MLLACLQLRQSYNRENNEVCNCLDASALGLHNSYFLLKAMVYNPQSNTTTNNLANEFIPPNDRLIAGSLGTMNRRKAGSSFHLYPSMLIRIASWQALSLREFIKCDRADAKY
jgi:hypothetical protein